MTDIGFPPRPTHPEQIAAMLSVFATVMEGRCATYVSSPFTTGRHAADWLAKNEIGHPEDALTSVQFREQVLVSNRERAGEFVRALRSRLAGASVVISPTALPDVAGWTQADYRFFWGRVIEEYAERVVFLDGWENSSGCAYEYLCAVRFCTTTLDERLKRLPPQEAVGLLHEAAAHSDVLANASFLRAAEAALREQIAAADEVHR